MPTKIKNKIKTVTETLKNSRLKEERIKKMLSDK